MLDAGAQSGPEAAACDDLAIRGAAVVVGTYSGSCGHIALSHDARRDEERIVVMLFVRREYQVVEHFAARDGGIVTQYRVDESCPVFQVALVAQHETYGHDGIEDTAAESRDAVHQDDALADLAWLFLRRIYGDVLQFAGAFAVAVGTHFDVFQDPTVLDDARLADGAVVAPSPVETFLSDLFQPLLKFRISAIFRPKIRVGGDHAVEWQYAPSAVLVHHFEPYPHVFWLSFLDDSVAELRMVGGGQLMDVEQDAAVADDVVCHVVYVMNGHIVADVARDDDAVGDAYGKAQVVVLKGFAAHPSDTHHAIETVVSHHSGVKIIGDPDVVPVGGGVAVLHQTLHLIGMQ